MPALIDRLTGSKIEDSSSQWLAEESNETEDVLTKSRLAKSPGDLNSALSQIDEVLNWIKRAVR